VPAQALAALDPAPGDARNDAALPAGAAAAGVVVALVAVQLGRAPARPAAALPDRRHGVEHRSSMELSWTLADVSSKASGMPPASKLVFLDGTIIRAHQKAAGAKGGA
jgi:hypothetical protein